MAEPHVHAGWVVPGRLEKAGEPSKAPPTPPWSVRDQALDEQAASDLL